MRYSRLALLLRNPSKYQLQRDETGWSCNSIQATDRGDRFILVRAGRVNLGIVSFGWILSSPSMRPVVRSALTELRIQGFIVSSRGVGSVVKRSRAFQSPPILLNPITELGNLKRCFEFRISLEGPMAALVATRSNTHDKIEIQRAFEETEAVYSKSGKAPLDTDIGFHLAIAEATHNRFFPQGMQMIRIQIADGMSKIQHFFVGDEARHSSIKSMEHGLILEAIVQGDSLMASRPWSFT